MHERHHLIWLSDTGWQRQLAQAADERQRAAMAQWQACNWPLVIRRADTDAGPDDICAGIALPPDVQGNKPRIALRVTAAEVAATRAPFLLRDIAAARLPRLPPSWQVAMDDLQAPLARAGISLAVFGSLAWQAITAQAYVRGTSDVDVLFRPVSRAQLEQGVRLLAYHAMFLPLDGEIVFPGGAAVSWKEWRQVAVLGDDADGRVLVKASDAVRLERVGTLAASLPEIGGEARCAA